MWCATPSPHATSAPIGAAATRGRTHPQKRPEAGCQGCCLPTAVWRGSTAACGSAPWLYLMTTWWLLAGVFTPHCTTSPNLGRYTHVGRVPGTNCVLGERQRVVVAAVLAGWGAGLRRAGWLSAGERRHSWRALASWRLPAQFWRETSSPLDCVGNNTHNLRLRNLWATTDTRDQRSIMSNVKITGRILCSVRRANNTAAARTRRNTLVLRAA